MNPVLFISFFFVGRAQYLFEASAKKNIRYFGLIKVTVTSSRWCIGYAELILYRLTGINLCMTRSRGDPFILAAEGLLLLPMLTASSNSGNVLLAKSLSAAVYLGRNPAMGILYSCGKTVIHVYSSRRVCSTRSGVSAPGPIVIPLDATYVLITPGDTSDKARSTRRRSVGNPSPLPNENLISAGFGVDTCKAA